MGREESESYLMRKLEKEIKNFLEVLEIRQTRRILRPFSPGVFGNVCCDGTILRNFSSNDYLGLANHSLLIQRACQWAESYGVGATASRLVCGTFVLHEDLERKLADFLGAESALILNTGFQANSTILPALLDSNLLGHKLPVVLLDRSVHASLYHGCAAAGVRPKRFRHNDLNHLESLLKKNTDLGHQLFILTESVFSMDGDKADIAGLAWLADRFGAILYIDEAHAIGMFGPGGAGLVADNANGRVDITVGTFSKAMGGFGAYVSCSHQLKEYLINRCTGFIYSTALPPPVLGAIDAAIDLVPYLNPEREKVLSTADRLRTVISQVGLYSTNSSTQIVPILFRDERSASTFSRILEMEYSFLVVAIRPPTVPIGTSRLRFTISAVHDTAAASQLLNVIPAMADLVNKQ